MARWTSKATVQTGHPDLTVDSVADALEDLIDEAEDIVEGDLSGMFDLYEIEKYTGDNTPKALARLATAKARELGYLFRNVGSLSENGNATYWKDEYARVLAGVKDGTILIDDDYKTSRTMGKAAFF